MRKEKSREQSNHKDHFSFPIQGEEHGDMNVNAFTVCAAAPAWPLAAIWFPPYGNLGAQQNPPPDSKAATDFSSALKAYEDRVAELIGNLGDAERAIAYKYLYATGMRIGNADEQLRKAIRKELRLD